MKRLSLITLTVLLSFACQRSHASPVDDSQSRSNDDLANVTRLTSCYEGDEWTCELEEAIVRKTNEKRVASGLGELEQVFESSYVARLHSMTMISDGDISHKDFDKRDDVLRQHFPGLNFAYRAENVAYMGGYRQDDPEVLATAFVDGWWGSSGHKKNILNSTVNFIGVGVGRDGDRVYATQIFH